jgi:CheY-like chemotaxis protein
MNIPLIALVSDNDGLAVMLHDVLADLGMHLLWCGAYESAYQVVCTQQPDLVLIDSGYRRVDLGLLVLNRLRLSPSLAALPIVIALSPEVVDGELSACLREANCEVVDAPLDIASVLKLLDRHLPPQERAVGERR